MLTAGLASPAWADCKLEKIVDLPVTMRGMAALITADVDGQKVEFAVDSGAFFSMMTPEAAARIGLKHHPLPTGIQVVGVGGRANDVEAVTVKKLDLGGVGVRSIEFLMGGANSLPGRAEGLLGQNVLRAADIEYDLANGMIRLWSPKGCGDARLAYWNADASSVALEPTSPAKPHLLSTATINGKRVHVMFDTGAATSVLTRDAAGRAGVTPTSTGAVSLGGSGGLGRRVRETWAAPFATIEIGGETIRNTRLQFADFDLLESDMLIGADFFLSHRVYVSTVQHKLYFTYNGGPVFRMPDGVQIAQGQAPAAPAPAGAAPAGTPPAAPAIPGVAEIAATAPVDAAGFARRGAAFAARRDFAKAVEDYTRASELEPANPKHFYGRALARLASGQSTLGLADLNEALKLEPTDVEAVQRRAELYLALGDEGRASIDFEAAAKLKPNDPALLMRRASAYTY